MTLQEMRTETRRYLDEATNVFFTDQDIDDALNDGWEELADAAEWAEREATITLKTHRTYYDLSTVLADSFLSLRRCWNTQTQRWLVPVDPRELDEGYRQWELNTGPPQKYFIRGLWWLGVWPAPPADSLGLRIYYTAVPPKLTMNSAEPAVPIEYQQSLIDFALGRLLAQERETKKSIQHFKLYGDLEAEFAQFVDKRQGLDRIDVL